MTSTHSTAYCFTCCTVEGIKARVDAKDTAVDARVMLAELDAAVFTASLACHHTTRIVMPLG